MRERITWMDTLRGLAILLLLVWHASGIPSLYGFEMPQWLYLANEVFLPWRMPTLMFLSGLLLERSLRKPLPEFYLGKVRLLLWPYVIWALVYMAMFPQEGSITSPHSWIATGYLWFIFFLFLYYVASPLVVRIPWWVLFPLLIVAALFAPANILQRLFYLAVFFFAGYYLRGAMTYISNVGARWMAGGVLATLAFTTVSIWMAATTQSHYFQYQVYALPAAFVMLFTSIRLIAALDRKYPDAKLVRAFSWVGRNSVVFYLTHFPIIGIACSLILLVGLPLTIWAVPVLFLLAVGIGTGLAVLGRRPPVRWLFAAPELRRRRAVVQNSAR